VEQPALKRLLRYRYYIFAQVINFSSQLNNLAEMSLNMCQQTTINSFTGEREHFSLSTGLDVKRSLIASHCICKAVAFSLAQCSLIVFPSDKCVHRKYSLRLKRRNSQVDVPASVVGYLARCFTSTKTVTHPTTNRARR